MMTKRQRREKMKAHKEHVRKKEEEERTCKCTEDYGFVCLNGNRICRKCSLIKKPEPKATPHIEMRSDPPGVWRRYSG